MEGVWWHGVADVVWRGRGVDTARRPGALTERQGCRSGVQCRGGGPVQGKALERGSWQRDKGLGRRGGGQERQEETPDSCLARGRGWRLTEYEGGDTDKQKRKTETRGGGNGNVRHWLHGLTPKI